MRAIVAKQISAGGDLILRLLLVFFKFIFSHSQSVRNQLLKVFHFVRFIRQVELNALVRVQSSIGAKRQMVNLIRFIGIYVLIYFF